MPPLSRRAAGRLLLAAAFAAAPFSAWALDWRVDVAASRLSIVYLENGEPQEGAFEQFDGSARFDPAHPETAALTLEFEVASIALPDTFRSEFVQTEAWFDSKRFPVARYELTRLTPLDGQRYASEGVLTIKGRSLPIETPLTLEVTETEATAEGALSFDRLDFALGDTVGGFFIDIGRTIEVRFRFVARRR